MLNRHAVVLLLGNAAILLLRPYPPAAFGVLGFAFLALLVGLLLDPSRVDLHGAGAFLMQGAGLVALMVAVGKSLVAGEIESHFLLAIAGIALVVVGALLEMLLPYRLLRVGIAIQALGDLLYAASVAVALLTRTQHPSAAGWTFIAIAGALGTYAALYNLILQSRRLRDLQTGWRYRVVAWPSDGLHLRTPSGEELVPWEHIREVGRIDRRHLVLVRSAPLAQPLSDSELPWQKLSEDSYGLVLHEQEVGCALAEAESILRDQLGRERQGNSGAVQATPDVAKL